MGKTPEELQEFYDFASGGHGCRCDPPGSGEEWCVGWCEERHALEVVTNELKRLVGWMDREHLFIPERTQSAITHADGVMHSNPIAPPVYPRRLEARHD